MAVVAICKNTRIAKVVHEWIAEGVTPPGVAPSKLDGFRNSPGAAVTLRVDSKVVHETDTGTAKADESRWMRFTLDTVGRRDWQRSESDYPTPGSGRPIYPADFEELAEKLGRPKHPPGRDVRCIVSVGMLTEGWDCNTVTHIVGLRPFRSQLLCEQVVGRGLRRAAYDVGEDGLLPEEVAKVFGVPFEVIPFKAQKGAAPAVRPKQNHVRARADREHLEIRFPRVEGYTQAVRNRVAVDWKSVPELVLRPERIPPEVEVKGISVSNQGRLSLSGPGKAEKASLEAFRRERRVQELVFDLAKALLDATWMPSPLPSSKNVPAHVLFPQLAAIVRRFVETKIRAEAPAEKIDLFLSPYFGWAAEILADAIHPDISAGEEPEIAQIEKNRPPGSTRDVDFFTHRDVREVNRSHVNYVVADTKQWEQSAAYRIDTHPNVEAFVKNAGLGFAVPYFANGQDHDYIPDFLVRLKSALSPLPPPGGEGAAARPGREAEGAAPPEGSADAHGHFLILEVKGHDEMAKFKEAAAERWCKAVNALGGWGTWRYAVAYKLGDVAAALEAHPQPPTIHRS